MKRIIAAALSILVGAFGYTIVDKAIEDRVATLESEVVELREEVSKYHPNFSGYDTTKADSELTTKKNETSTKRRATTTQVISTLSPATADDNLQVGDYLAESPNSQHKFLLRKWSNGRIQYISPDQYGKSTSQYVAITSPIDDRLTMFSTTVVPITAEPTTLQDEVITRAPDEVVNDGTISGDYYLYITDASAYITDISVKPSHYYDNNYSMVSVDKQTITVKYTFKGHTDPVFAGKTLSFGFDYFYPFFKTQTTVISDTVNQDGTFEYCITRSFSDVNLNTFKRNCTYNIANITVK